MASYSKLKPYFILLLVANPSLLFPLLPALDVTSDPSSVKPESSCVRWDCCFPDLVGIFPGFVLGRAAMFKSSATSM